MSRTYLIDNIRLEKHHADQWIDMTHGFGVSLEELSQSPILAEVEALTHWLWSITTRGSFTELVAAMHYSIEGITQVNGCSLIGKHTNGWKRTHATIAFIHLN